MERLPASAGSLRFRFAYRTTRDQLTRSLLAGQGQVQPSGVSSTFRQNSGMPFQAAA